MCSRALRPLFALAMLSAGAVAWRSDDHSANLDTASFVDQEKGELPGVKDDIAEFGFHIASAEIQTPFRMPRGGAAKVKEPEDQLKFHDKLFGMLKDIKLVAPGWCQPCSKEVVQFAVDGTTYYVETPASFQAGNEISVFVPQPLPDTKPVDDGYLYMAVGWYSVGDVQTLWVQVPEERISPGMMMAVHMPKSSIQHVKVPPGIHSGQIFTFTYNPKEEADTTWLEASLEAKYRCCCQEVDGKCLWYLKGLVRDNGKCPRLQDTDGEPRCVKSECPTFGAKKKGCTKTYHSKKNDCPISEAKEHYFVGEKCGLAELSIKV